MLENAQSFPYEDNGPSKICLIARNSWGGFAQVNQISKKKTLAQEVRQKSDISKRRSKG